ncbi:NRAMP family divalent metal transporter [Andreprevotia chitinilytica]|uniref:NRAMP family divalent metal transporter n=1 Tax=Andreprevotia chitinilytica TaxID=396808 RepID=UPI001B80738A|nr:divalent metal cation transporter [Andreprevotia chitinilytica]
MHALGPGLVTGASDDDPSGIGTYSQVGAQFGFGMLWTMLFSYPLMVSIQLICARIGRVTGHGVAGNLRRYYPAWLLYPIVLLLLIANTINIGADLGAMSAALHLLVGGPVGWYTAAFGVTSALLQVFVPYHYYVRVLKCLTLALFAYVATVLVIHIPWLTVAKETLLPALSFKSEYVTAVVAILGTTISPYLFFWQASQEVEDQEAAPTEHPLKQAPSEAPKQLARIKLDTWIGMGLSNFVAFFIILTTAVTLFAHGVTNIDSASKAAEALRPIAGNFAFFLFAAGIIGTGLLAIPVLAGSAAYGVGEALKWITGLEKTLAQAHGFYAVIVLATLAGVGMNYSGINPIKALFWTAVINGVIAVPILVVIMLMAVRPKIMGAFVVSRRLLMVGWLTTVVMGLSVIGMLITWPK